MIEDLKHIFAIGIADTLKSPQYLIALIRIYSKIYLGGASCRTCENSCRKYFDRLKKDGMTKLEIIEEVKKRTCKPAFKGLVHSQKAGGHINPEFLTDELAEFYLLNGILAESNFEVLPKSYIENKRVKEIPYTNLEPETLATTDLIEEKKEVKSYSKNKKK